LLLHSSYLPLGVPNGLVITTHKDLLLPRQLHATALFWSHHQVAVYKDKELQAKIFMADKKNAINQVR
jgi:hypothetical protein